MLRRLVLHWLFPDGAPHRIHTGPGMSNNELRAMMAALRGAIVNKMDGRL